jgi:hypothetical protein
MPAPVKGKCYTHTDLGFKFPENLTSFAERGTFVMVRYFPDGPYLCLGEIDYVERYDMKRNKVFFKESN